MGHTCQIGNQSNIYDLKLKLDLSNGTYLSEKKSTKYLWLKAEIRPFK